MKTNFCGSTITPQVPEELAFINNLVAWICLLCPLSVVVGEQTKTSYILLRYTQERIIKNIAINKEK